MSEPAPETRRPLVGVGVVCLRGTDVLLVRRSKPPLAGAWSLPAGHLEWSETLKDAALRELREETGVEAQILGLIDVVDGFFPGADPAEDRHYALIDYAALWLSGEPQAGDDAAEARFHPLADIPALGLWPQTQRIILEGAARFGA